MLSRLKTCRQRLKSCLRDLKDWIKSRKCSIGSYFTNREYLMSTDIAFSSYLEQKRQLTSIEKNPTLFQKCLFSNYLRCS